MNYEKSRFYLALKKAYDRLIRIRANPREIALGFALGIFIGVSPTIGFQMAIAVFLAALLKWNKVSAAIGVWISNPLTVPIIYGITYLIGAKLLGIGETDGFVFDHNMLSKAPEIMWVLVVGGIILGIPLSVIGYYFCYSAVQKYQEDIRKKLALQKERLARQKEKLAKRRKEKKRKKKKSDKKS